jgi:hypothetical protein
MKPASGKHLIESTPRMPHDRHVSSQTQSGLNKIADLVDATHMAPKPTTTGKVVASDRMGARISSWEDYREGQDYNAECTDLNEG